MAAIYRETVTGRAWLTPEKYAVSYALARITPGTNLLAFCAGTAWELLGWPGAIAGVLAASVPSAIIVTLLTEGYDAVRANGDRKSTRLNSSHPSISYAVFCLKKKIKERTT